MYSPRPFPHIVSASLLCSGMVFAADVRPTITTQPADQHRDSGQAAAFSVVVGGSPAPSVQWYRNGVLIPDATAATYTLPTTALADDGARYHVVATNRAGTVTSTTAVLMIPAPAPWASARDLDASGPAPWADMTVTSHDLTATQRFRWIPAGTFTMGCDPADVRFEDGEWGWALEPQHQVTLTRGFWMADSECTQRFYKAVTGTNPSHYTATGADGLELPVENMDRNGVMFSSERQTSFLALVSTLAGEHPVTLPTEAQWEYACRAGTTTPYYRGAYTAVGDANIPGLDEIAWYNGNAGRYVGETAPTPLDDTSGFWSNRQYPQVKLGTHHVKKKKPNAWGLYDMLGNVSEFTSDTYTGNFGSDPVVDPAWPAKPGDRISFHGHSIYDAKKIRASSRHNTTASSWQLWGFRLSMPGTVAPTIVRQPADLAVVEGSAASFTVVVHGNPQPTFRWQRHGVDIAGATAATLTLPAPTVADDGADFHVIITNVEGTVTSAEVHLAVVPRPVAPTFTLQPSGHVFAPGESVTLHGTASSIPAARYQWFRNDAPIPDATSDTLTVVTTEADDHAVFRLQASNAGGTVLSAAAELQIIAVPWASAQGRDASGTWADLTVTGHGLTVVQRFRLIPAGFFDMGMQPGESGTTYLGANNEVNHRVQFSEGFWLADSECTQRLWKAVMGTAPSYFTRSDAAGLEFPVEQVAWLDITDATGFFSTLKTLAPRCPAMLPSESQWEYACRAGTATRFDGQAASVGPMAWYQGNAASYGGEPAPASLVGGAGTHQVKHRAANAWGLYDMIGNVAEWTQDGYLFAWGGGTVTDPIAPPQASYNMVRGQSWADAADTCRASYRFATSQAKGSGLGGGRSNTLGFRLSVPFRYAPQITVQPEDVTVVSGAHPRFAVQALGSPVPTYQWQRNGVDIGGATAAEYEAVATTVGDPAATYAVRITNSLGTVTSRAAALRVQAAAVAPTITTQPAAAAVAPGGLSTFTVVAAGVPAPTYQWRRQGVAIPGATSASYTTPSASLGDNGATFSVVVTNSAGSVTSQEAVWTVTADDVAPAVVQQPTDQAVSVGQVATFTLGVSGAPVPTVQWYRNAVAISGAMGVRYTTAATVLGDDGAQFSAVATNARGSVTSAVVTLHVSEHHEAPTITTQPVAVAVDVGQEITLAVVASGGPGLSYQWYHDDAALTESTAATCTIPRAATTDAGQYRVVVTTSGGSVTSDTVLVSVTASAAPSIVTAPVDLTVREGEAARFSVSVTGTPTPTLQWYRGTTPIAGATTAEVRLPAVTAADNGTRVHVVATNRVGTATSTEAVLTVRVRPVAQALTVTLAEDTPTALELRAIGMVVAQHAIVQAPRHGTLADTRTGLMYTPAENFFGTDTFTFTVAGDDGLMSAAAQATLTVTPVNDAPRATAVVLADHTGTTGEEVRWVLPAGLFDDVDGDAVRLALTGLPAGLTWTASAGLVSGTPTTVGEQTVTITATDGHGGSATRHFRWVIIPAEASSAAEHRDSKGGCGSGSLAMLTLASLGAWMVRRRRRAG